MRLRRGCRGWWIALLAALADRITKAAVLAAPRADGPLIPGIMNIRLTANRGMAFSMLSGQTLGLTLLTAVLVAALTGWLIARPDEPKLLRAGLWMIVGGGLGNLYDRLTRGSVVDFLEPAFVRFAVFNVADACITVGAALAILALVLGELRGRKTHGG